MKNRMHTHVFLYRHHPIHIPLHRMHSLCTDERQCLAELVGVHPSHHLGRMFPDEYSI